MRVHNDAMTPWRVRDFHADDLDAAVRLWDNPAASSEAPAFGLSDLIAAVRAHEPAVVAVVGEELVGTAVATVGGDRAWVMRISLASAWRHKGIGSAMLGELERRLVAAGVHRIQCLLAGETELGALALEHAGYTTRRGMVFYERLEPVHPASAGVLGQLGGRMVRVGAWEQLGGMAREKELIERRVILPLAQPQLADRLGVAPPRAIVLFGPPGTGKTTFAKGVASRLGWPFVELFPSRLAGESPAGLAAALREAFALIAELDKVVVFIDEVEEIAGARQPRTVSAAQGVTNEMLKLIPPFREQDERLLICATNSVRALDSAFLRHGRFDYVIPVGPPDPAARGAIWDRYLAAIPHSDLDMAAIVQESRLFTPADIEFAARRTAQLAFERVLFERGEEEVTTADVLQGIGQTRRTLTSELVADFEQDIQAYARVLPGRVEQVVDEQQLGDGQRLGALALCGPAQARRRLGVGAEPGPDRLLHHHAVLAGRVPVHMQGIHRAAVRVAGELEVDGGPRAFRDPLGHHAVQVRMPDGRPQQQFGRERRADGHDPPRQRREPDHDVGVRALRADERGRLGLAPVQLREHLFRAVAAFGGVPADLPCAPDLLGRIQVDGRVEAGAGQLGPQRQQAFDDDELARLDQHGPGEPPGVMVVDGLEDRLAHGKQLQVLFHDLDVVAGGV
jgi:transitional endoplasmic reticulum ATPase